MLTAEKKMKKFYLTTTSFFPILNKKNDKSKLMENLVIVFTNAGFFWRTPQKYEVDVILEKNNEIIPIEVKYREYITKKDMKNLLRFCERFKSRKALMITKDKSGEEEFLLRDKRKIKIEFIPAWLFLLTI
jgi:predicted AAA+ superfamily ATPase